MACSPHVAGVERSIGPGTPYVDPALRELMWRNPAVSGRPLRPGALEAEQALLHVEPAAVAAEAAAGREHAVARDDERHRVRAERVPRGAGAPRAAGQGGDLRVRGVLAVRDRRGPAEPLALERPGEPPVDPEVEAPPPALEVLVELPPDVVERA